MGETKTLKTKQVRGIWCSVWSAVLAMVLTFINVKPIPSVASSDSQDNNQIILPADGEVVVNFVSTSAACTGDFGLHSPQEILIYPNYLYYAGLPFPLPGYFTQGTELVFYIIPRDFCSGGPYLSTDPSRARITHPNANTWIIAWEDWTDADFNDLVVQIDFQPVTVPFLDLSYEYTGSTFADESRDTEQGGKVNAYFDHQYPTYCAPPNTGGCSPTDTKAVNFHGYDGDPDVKDQPPYKVAYNGHDGIDYWLDAGTSVLAAGIGTVTFVGGISLRCSDGVTRTANVVKVQHPNNYVTEYWHLSSFVPGISVGSSVTRDPASPIGYVGRTGCVTGPHLHFAVRSSSGIIVDPYGWTPKPDAAWYGQTDPWQQYHTDHDGLDAASYYLWIHPVGAVVLVSPSASTVITSTSDHIVASIPAGAYSAPLRIELVETLQSTRIPGYRSLYSFSLVGYTAEDVPVLTLAAEVTLHVHTSTSGTQALTMSTAMTPTLQVWDAQASIWRELPTSWDSLTGVASATSSQIGTFALSVHEYLIYLPVALKHGHWVEP